MEERFKSIDSLKTILDSRPDLREALITSISKAEVDEVKTIPQYFELLEKMLTEIPTQRGMSDFVSQFHYVIAYSPQNILNEDPVFTNWLHEYAIEHGNYLNTPQSAKGLDTFIQDPSYHIDDYDQGPGGWFTFNQFFTRRL